MIRILYIVLVFCVAAAFGQPGTHGLLEYWAQDDGVVISAVNSSVSGALVIPETIDGLPVVKIDDNVFNNCDTITSLNFPSTLKAIDYRAFYKCDGFNRVDIPEGVESLGKDAFWQCGFVTTITVPASLTSIGEFALGNCNRLASIEVDPANSAYADVDGVLYNRDLSALIVYPERWRNSRAYVIPNGTKSINDRAFNGVGYLRGITIPDSVFHIGEYAFVGCVNWTNVILPEATTAIGYGAFMNCRKLPSIHVPAAVEHIGDKAFESCSLLSGITVASSNPFFSSISGVLYNKAQTRLICCPAGWQGNYVAPPTLESVGYRAFYKCSGIKQITLSDSVETIADEAFRNCYGLTNLVISSSLETLGKQMFLGCSSLQSFQIDPANPNFSDIDGVLFNKDGTILLAYPTGRTGSYTVPDGVEVIYDYAFANCDGLTEVVLPAGVVDVARDAFKDCENLVSITMSGSLARLGRDVFDLNPNLAQIIISPAGSEYASVDGVLFSADGKRLIRYPEGRAGKYAVPVGTEEIDWHGFYRCFSLSGVSIPSTVNTLGNNAFSSCSALPSVIFFDDAPAVGGSAFSSVASGFGTYHLADANGFSSPAWSGYPCAVLQPPRLVWANGGHLSWYAQQGIDYHVEISTNLAAGAWDPLIQGLVAGDGTTNSILPDYTADSEMFRVRIDLP